MVSIIKTIVIGPYSVGKTSLVNKYMMDKFNNYDVAPTIGVDFQVKNTIIDDKEYRLQIWDTAGHERFYSLTKSYYKNADCIIFCFSLNNRYSLFELEKMISDYQDTVGNNNKIIKILVGTQSDQCKDTYENVEYDLISSLMLKYYIPFYYETSAKTGLNIDKLFEETLLKTFHNRHIENNKRNNNTLVSFNDLIKDDDPYNKCCTLI